MPTQSDSHMLVFKNSNFGGMKKKISQHLFYYFNQICVNIRGTSTTYNDCCLFNLAFLSSSIAVSATAGGGLKTNYPFRVSSLQNMSYLYIYLSSRILC